MPSRCLCVLNAGSSSLKFALYRVAPDGTPIRALSGEVERIGGEGRLLIAPADVDGIAAMLREAATSGLDRHYRPHDLDRYRFPAPAVAFADAVEAAIKRRAATRER